MRLAFGCPLYLWYCNKYIFIHQLWETALTVHHCKYIYNLLHCDITVQQIVKYKLLSPTSIFADNYIIYLCNKYNIAHSDWKRDMPFITNMICTWYTNHQYDICKTVTEVCELRDSVAHCIVVNRRDICSLLEVSCTD